jgi:sugar (pentulose or hexulose) kinase
MYLGIDLTSAVKTVLVDRAQRVIASRPLRMASPRPGLAVCRDEPLARIFDRFS